MQELNQMLEQYIETPKPQSLPRLKYIPSPTGAMTPENQEEFQFLMNEFYKGNRYTYDTENYERNKLQLDEFLFYRRKFEQSQRAAMASDPKAVNEKGVPLLNLQNLDPR